MADEVIPLLKTLCIRLGVFIATLLGVVVGVEGLLFLTPGDAIDLLPNSDQLRPILAREWGLDLPPLARLSMRLGRILSGDLGISLSCRPGALVSELLQMAGERSLLLLLPALLLSISTGLVLAMITVRRGHNARLLIRLFSVTPAFLAAFLLVSGINAFCWSLIQAGRIDRPTWFALPNEDSPMRSALAIVILAYASGTLSDVHQHCEHALRRILDAPYILSLRARGAPVLPAIARNLLPELATVIAGRTGVLLSGLVVVEKLLLLNGAGALLWQACAMRDHPLVEGLALGAAVLVCGSHLLADLVRIQFDPRLRAA